MKILNHYIAKQLISFILIVTLALLGIDLFFYLINELRYVGKGNYHIDSALLFLLLTIPRKIYLLFPWAALIGTLLALGNLSRHAELTAMRVAGCSMGQLVLSTLKAAFIIVVLMFVFGEVVAPFSEQLAQRKKTLALSAGQMIPTHQGTWYRRDNEFIQVDRLMVGEKLQSVTRYQLDDDKNLHQAIWAKSAEKKEDGGWVFYEVKGTELNHDNTKIFTKSKIEEPALLDIEILKTSVVKHLERLSLKNLMHVIAERKAHELDAREYQLAFWVKLFQPLAILTMVLLAIPFVFGPLRTSSMGSKLIVGILVGFAFHVSNALCAPLIVVMNLPPIAAAAIPVAVFASIGWAMVLSVR